MPAENVAVLMPKGMTFAAGAGAAFKSVPEDPNVQTFIVKNATPGKVIEFTVSGNGSMPREQQGAPAGQPSGAGMGGQDASAAGGQPGGGIGNPINTPDPLSKYKWWILGGLALLLAAAAAFLLRKPAGAPAAGAAADAGPVTYNFVSSPATKNTALLNVLKEELFSLESEKLSGTIAPDEYAKQKSALEIVLSRALSKK